MKRLGVTLPKLFIRQIKTLCVESWNRCGGGGSKIVRAQNCPSSSVPLSTRAERDADEHIEPLCKRNLVCSGNSLSRLMWHDGLGASKSGGNGGGYGAETCHPASDFSMSAQGGGAQQTWSTQGLNHGGCCSNGACDMGARPGNGVSEAGYGQGGVGNRCVRATSVCAR